MEKIINKIKNAISGSEFENKTYIAGGFVRDSLLNQFDNPDLDIVVELDDGGKRLAKFLHKKKIASYPIIYRNFGTAKSEIDNVIVEFVMTRSESYRKNNRNPKVIYATIEQDVMRRDFTINSLLQNITTGEILDLSKKGFEDLKNGIIRATDNPEIIFDQDPLRIMRAIRYATRFRFTIEPNTANSIRKNAEKLVHLKWSRISDELQKIMLFDKPSKYLDLMRELNIWTYLIPPITKLFNLPQNKKYHDNNAWYHTLNVVDKVPKNRVLRFAALLHDIGKGETFSENETGIHFYQHEVVGIKIIEEFFENLVLAKDEKREIIDLVRNHMKAKSFGAEAEIVKNKTLANFVFFNKKYLSNLLLLIDADNKSHKQNSPIENQVSFLRERIERECQPILQDKFPLNGNDIIDEFGLSGKIVGELLNFAIKKWLSDFSLDKEKLLNLIFKENRKNILNHQQKK